jgi:serine/threonine protein kinase
VRRQVQFTEGGEGIGGNRPLVVRISDLGLSKSSTLLKTVRGSPPYMAPEMFTSHGSVGEFDDSIDIYAFAFCLYHLWAGDCFLILPPDKEEFDYAVVDGQMHQPRRPDMVLYDQERRINVDLGNDLWKLITDCWALDHTKRPSMKKVVVSLARLLKEQWGVEVVRGRAIDRRCSRFQSSFFLSYATYVGSLMVHMISIAMCNTARSVSPLRCVRCSKCVCVCVCLLCI